MLVDVVFTICAHDASAKMISSTPTPTPLAPGPGLVPELLAPELVLELVPVPVPVPRAEEDEEEEEEEEVM